jgi:D-alanyl-D-alanine carboxypeptidase/D-alanyl-D-alanine-endopeptidase (penicillin-binding protein 4)
VKRFLALALGCLALAATVSEGARPAPRRRRVSRPVNLVWYAETLDGQPVEARQPDEPINPASVVKIATSLWSLERLGPDFRFETRFFARGRIDPVRRVLNGDLVVQGGGDPDFHVENAFLVAQALNELHVERVTGAVIVDRRFWMGWENGSEGRQPDPVKRGILMATRLRQALNPGRWNGATRAAWREFALRRNLDASRPPRVVVAGGAGVDGKAAPGEMLVVHRSQPLADILRRFNCYSNNDIERVAASVGPVDDLAAFVAERCGVPRDSVELQTASGLGENRLTPRLIVHLLREFKKTCERLHLSVESLLPVAGCDPGTVNHQFPELADGPNTTAVVGKTGTLTTTDGGIAVLAGIARTGQGDLLFCVAVPHAGGRLKGARYAEEKWVLDLLAAHGGGQPRPCAGLLTFPDTGASVILLGDHVLPPPEGTSSVTPARQPTAPVNR